MRSRIRSRSPIFRTSPSCAADGTSRPFDTEDIMPTHHTHLGWNDHHVDADGIKATRAQMFVSYGSCGVAEPVVNLEALGILTTAPA